MGRREIRASCILKEKGEGEGGKGREGGSRTGETEKREKRQRRETGPAR